MAMFVGQGSSQQDYSSAIKVLAKNQLEDLSGQRRPDFKLRDMNGTTVSSSEFDGKIILVNFWATWCKPCIDEMPMLARLKKNYDSRGLQIVGIALDEPHKVREFVSELAINYPILVGSAETILASRQYGNGAGMLPYSVLVGTDGIIRWAHLGALDKDEVESQIKNLL